MKKSFTFLFSLLVIFNSFGRITSLSELKQQLSEIGKDTSSLKAIVLVVSDEISDENAKSISASFEWWEKRLPMVDFVFTGKRKVFKEKLRKNTLENDNAFLDSKGLWKEQMGSDHVMEVYYVKEDKIVKQAAVSNSDFHAEYVNVTAWNLGMPYGKMLTPFPDSLLAVKTKSPSITALSTTGEEIDLDDLKGSIVILNFWADRYPDCSYAMSIIERLYNENQNVKVISFYKDTPESLAKYFNEDKPYFESGFNTFPIIANAGSIIEDYKIQAFSKTYIIDQHGVIAHVSGTIGNETYDYDSDYEKSDNPYYYLMLKGVIDRLLVE